MERRSWGGGGGMGSDARRGGKGCLEFKGEIRVQTPGPSAPTPLGPGPCHEGALPPPLPLPHSRSRRGRRGGGRRPTPAAPKRPDLRSPRPSHRLDHPPNGGSAMETSAAAGEGPGDKTGGLPGVQCRSCGGRLGDDFFTGAPLEAAPAPGGQSARNRPSAPRCLHL